MPLPPPRTDTHMQAKPHRQTNSRLHRQTNERAPSCRQSRTWGMLHAYNQQVLRYRAHLFNTLRLSTSHSDPTTRNAPSICRARLMSTVPASAAFCSPRRPHIPLHALNREKYGKTCSEIHYSITRLHAFRMHCPFACFCGNGAFQMALQSEGSQHGKRRSAQMPLCCATIGKHQNKQKPPLTEATN